MNEDQQLTVEEVEYLMTKTIVLSKEESELQYLSKRNRIILFLSCGIIFVLEALFFIAQGYTFKSIPESMITVEGLMLLLGIYLTFFAKEILPHYYDENKINVYSHGPFRINVHGLTFNNSNWKHILKAIHRYMMSVLILYPLLYLTINHISPSLWEKGELIFSLGAVLSLFIPMYLVGIKYE